MVMKFHLILLTIFFSALTILHGQNVIINEVMSSNSTVIADEDGDYSDWLELYNGGDSSVSIANWAFSDEADDPFKWLFPEISLSPGSYLLVFPCSERGV